MLLSLLPVEGVTEADLGEMEQFVGQALPFDTRIEPAMSVPAGAYDPKRDQYDGTVMLRAALALCPADAVRLLVITERDLFIPMLTFIFGQAQLDGTAAIVSLARLRPEFHGLPARPKLFVDRYRKEILHELGHTFGLTHCTDSRCAMSLSIKIMNIDLKRAELCHGCHVRLADKLDTLRRAADAAEE
jgi:archaemetzincin